MRTIWKIFLTDGQRRVTLLKDVGDCPPDDGFTLSLNNGYTVRVDAKSTIILAPGNHETRQVVATEQFKLSPIQLDIAVTGFEKTGWNQVQPLALANNA